MAERTGIEWADAIGGANRILCKAGYVIVRCPSYPGVKRNGYVYEHRLVVARSLGRALGRDEVVHHINGNRQDNRLENLVLTTNPKHMASHMADRTPQQRRIGVPALLRHATSVRRPRVQRPCKCGCGTMIETPDAKGRERRYVHGHNQRGRTWRWSHDG